MSTSHTQEQIVEATMCLVNFKTTADQLQEQKQCLAKIAEMFRDDFQATFYTFYGHPALVLRTQEEKTSDIILSGHIDVVHGDEKLFSVRREGDILYGRGVYDMKGPLIAALFGVRDAVRANAKKSVMVLITADEETSGRGTQALLSKEGYRGGFALIPDGGDKDHIITAQKGFAQFAITIRGTSTHASRPWEGANPIIKATDFVNAIKERYTDPVSADDWKTSVVPTKINSGTILNQIPNSTTVYFDMRYVSEQDPQALISWINKTFKDDVVVEVVAENGMFKVDEDDPKIRKLQRIIGEQTDVTPVFSRECGTSDAIFFSEHGIPAALFRPEGGGAHADGEWVNIKSLHVVYRVAYEYLHTEI